MNIFLKVWFTADKMESIYYIYSMVNFYKDIFHNLQDATH